MDDRELDKRLNEIEERLEFLIGYLTEKTNREVTIKEKGTNYNE